MRNFAAPILVLLLATPSLADSLGRMLPQSKYVRGKVRDNGDQTYFISDPEFLAGSRWLPMAPPNFGPHRRTFCRLFGYLFDWSEEANGRAAAARARGERLYFSYPDAWRGASLQDGDPTVVPFDHLTGEYTLQRCEVKPTQDREGTPGTLRLLCVKYTEMRCHNEPPLP
jgi:hypothetical protein